METFSLGGATGAEGVWAQSELGLHHSHFRIEREWFLNGGHYRKTIQARLDNYLANLKIFEDQLDLSKRNIAYSITTAITVVRCINSMDYPAIKGRWEQRTAPPHPRPAINSMAGLTLLL